MSNSSERGRFPETGRSYSTGIDYIDAYDLLGDYEEKYLKGLKRDKEKYENAEGFEGYIFGNLKGNSSFPTLTFETISRNRGSVIEDNGRKFFGVLGHCDDYTDFSFVDSKTGSVIIPRGARVAMVYLPRVDFTNLPNTVITPKMISESLSLLAQYLKDSNSKDRHVMALTHPRMGKLATRWQFNLEEHPFPKEVYDFMDIALADPNADPDKKKSLEICRNQVLVYQSTPQFIANTLRSNL